MKSLNFLGGAKCHHRSSRIAQSLVRIDRIKRQFLESRDKLHHAVTKPLKLSFRSSTYLASINARACVIVWRIRPPSSSCNARAGVRNRAAHPSRFIGMSSPHIKASAAIRNIASWRVVLAFFAALFVSILMRGGIEVDFAAISFRTAPSGARICEQAQCWRCVSHREIMASAPQQAS